MSSKHQAFTLAELLIALAILGIIATFAIPKVLQAQQNGQRISVFKETIAAVSTLVYQGSLTGELRGNSAQILQYYLDHTNYVKVCPADVVGEGCLDSTYSTYTDPAALVLASGAVISDLDAGCGSPTTCNDAISVDWNGTAGPNQQGDDRIILRAYYGTNPGGGNRTGQVKADGSIDGGASDTLWEEIFR